MVAVEEEVLGKSDDGAGVAGRADDNERDPALDDADEFMFKAAVPVGVDSNETDRRADRYTKMKG